MYILEAKNIDQKHLEARAQFVKMTKKPKKNKMVKKKSLKLKKKKPFRVFN